MKPRRVNVSFAIFTIAAAIIIARLYYWQVIASESLSSLAEKQHFTTFEIATQRGEVRTNDNFPLATNEENFVIYSYLPQMKKSPAEIANLLAPIYYPLFEPHDASPSAQEQEKSSEELARESFFKQLSRSDVSWVPLVRNSNLIQKKAVEKLKIEGIGSEQSFSRAYPEGIMAANVLGFVGSDIAGNQKGYFGLEGKYNLELKGRPGIIKQERDASGKPILIGQYDQLEPKPGRHLILHLDRAVQKIAEEKLSEALVNYGAKSGEVVIMEPKTGAIIAMASKPTYDPSNFSKFDNNLYKNPVISETYEPGSTFKVITMASALDAKAVKPETKCEICDKPVHIGSYTIRTWNNEYHPNSTMTQVIQNSDNLGMVYAVSKLGKDKLLDYLDRFGIGKKTNIDLEEEVTPILRDKDDWKEIDLATASFGQGIAVTGIQIVRAIGVIANKGELVVPRIVDRVVGEKVNIIPLEKKERVISETSAEIMTQMLVNAVENGEAKWLKPKGYEVAGKTGTAQIPVAGHYDQEKTIASFVGFAPASDPKFVMLVKLREPQSSPWGSETAAPLWFSIAKDLFNYYEIQASK